MYRFPRKSAYYKIYHRFSIDFRNCTHFIGIVYNDGLHTFPLTYT